MRRAEALIEKEIEELCAKNPELRKLNDQLDAADRAMQNEHPVGKMINQWHAGICRNCMTLDEIKKMPVEDAIYPFMIKEGGELWLCTRCRHLIGMKPEEERELVDHAEGRRFIADTLKAIDEDLKNDLVRNSPQMLQDTIAFQRRLQGILRREK